MPDTPTTSPPENAIREGALVRLPDGTRAVVGEINGLVAMCARVTDGGCISDDEAAFLVADLILLIPTPYQAIAAALASDEPPHVHLNICVDKSGPMAVLAEITAAAGNLAAVLNRCEDILGRLPAPIDALTLQASGLTGQIDAMRGTIAAMGPALAKKGEAARDVLTGNGFDHDLIRQKVKAATASAVTKIAELAPLEPTCTRRDRAAHAALTGLLPIVERQSAADFPHWLARRAYELADAMELAAEAPPREADAAR